MEDKFEYFINQTNLRLDRIDGRFDKVDTTLEALISFRMLLIGISVAISVIFSTGTTLLMLFLMRNGG